MRSTWQLRARVALTALALVAVVLVAVGALRDDPDQPAGRILGDASPTASEPDRSPMPGSSEAGAGEGGAGTGPVEPAPQPAHQWTVTGDLPPVPGEPEPIPPGHLGIASLGILAPLDSARIELGEFAVPPPSRVGVHRSGTADDLDARLNAGPGVILAAGHVTFNQQLGVFHELHRLEPGAEITLSNSAGDISRWRATELRTVAHDALPADLLAAEGPARLVLVTCAGEVVDDAGRRAYADNLVVTAVPI